MDYPTTLVWLEEVQSLGIKLGLDNMRRLLAALDDPQRSFPAVVVAGTNGKGSVCAFLDSILRASGLRTGLYTSPHLVRYEERIMVDGAPVTAAEFAEAVSAVRDSIDSLLSVGALGTHPTHFEILTAAAWLHFRKRAVQAGVLEVGMGGRLDAVAAARTAVAVITNVTLEHTRFLGDTVEAIAREKAGIIQEGCWVVTAETNPEALAVIRAQAAGRGVRLIERHTEAVVTHAPSSSAGRFGLTTRRRVYGELVVPLAGRHQVENATLAVLAAEAMAESSEVELPAAAVVEGLARAQWPGRLQIAGDRPLLLLDGAHNPAACETLARALKDLRDGGSFKNLTLIVGVLQDKELEPMLRHLLPVAERLVATRGRSERFRKPREIAEMASMAVKPGGADVMVEEDLEAALQTARSLTPEAGAICLCGSLYLVGDAMSLLGIEPFGLSRP